MNQKTVKILICGEDRQIVEFVQDSLKNSNYYIQHFDEIENLIRQLSPGDFHVLLLELRRELEKGKLDIFSAIQILRKIDPALPVIAIACNDSLELEKNARMAGIFYYLVKPLEANEIRMAVNNAIKKFEREIGEK